MKVRLANPAASALRKVTPETRIHILQSIKDLENNPFPPPPRGKQLSGLKPTTYRLRVGDYRIIYRKIESELVVLSVIHRRDLETEIKKIKKH